MPRLVFTDTAREDLLVILRYITRESGSRAIGRNFVNMLQMQCAKLAALPGMMGRARPELKPEIRSVPFKGYVIVFRYADDDFVVVNILEGHRDIDGHFRDAGG